MTLTIYTAGVFLGHARAYYRNDDAEIAADFLRHAQRMYDQLVETWPNPDAATLAKMAEDIAIVERMHAKRSSK